MIDYVFFDVGETLLYKNIFPVIKQVLQDFSFSIPLAKIKVVHQKLSDSTTFPIKTDKQFYNSFNSHFLTALSVPPSPEILDVLYTQLKNIEWKPYEDVLALEKIPIKKGIISNWDNTLKKKVDLVDCVFYPMVFSDQTGLSKPNPLLFKQAFNQVDCSYASILYVGNSPKLDIEPVLKLGAQAILIDRENRYKQFRGLKISSLYELLGHLKIQTG